MTVKYAFVGAFVGGLIIGGTLALAQVPQTSSIQTKPAPAPTGNLWVLYYDEAFLFASHFGNSRDPSGEPVLLVHSKSRDRWMQIAAISTAGARLGKSSPDMRTSVIWDFSALAERSFAKLPLRTSGSLMWPDRVRYDSQTERYELRHASKSGVLSAMTVLYVLRADLDAAFQVFPGQRPKGAT
jgi:hypothetical protein